MEAKYMSKMYPIKRQERPNPTAFQLNIGSKVVRDSGIDYHKELEVTAEPGMIIIKQKKTQAPA
jgi:hypothetical protein